MPDLTTAPDVKQSYEGAWSAARKAIEAEIATGESSLSRLLHRSFPNIGGARSQPGGLSRIFGVEAPAPFITARRISRDWIADSVIAEAARIQADAIVELGSGFGYNLFNIWLRGGPRVDYHAFEYTEAGRQACLRLREASREGPHVRVHPVDYYAFDLGGVRGRYSRPLFYTSHSIEQIRQLPEAVIEALLAAAPAVSVMHFEPVGWQLDPDSEASRQMRPHCEREGYNENLWPMLQQMQAAGRLVIEEAAANVMAAKLHNASTLIRWRKP